MAASVSLSRPSVNPATPNVQVYKVQVQTTDGKISENRVYAFNNCCTWDPENFYDHPNGDLSLTGLDLRFEKENTQTEFLARNQAEPMVFDDGLDTLRQRYSRKGILELLQWQKDPKLAGKVPEAFKKYCYKVGGAESSCEKDFNPQFWKNSHYFQSELEETSEETYGQPWKCNTWDDKKEHSCTLQEQYFVEKTFLIFSRAIKILEICQKEWDVRQSEKPAEASEEQRMRFASINYKQEQIQESFHLEIAAIINDLVNPLAEDKEFSVEAYSRILLMNHSSYISTYDSSSYLFGYWGTFVSVKLLSKKDQSKTVAAPEISELDRKAKLVRFHELLLGKNSREINHEIVALASQYPDFLNMPIADKNGSNCFPVHYAIFHGMPYLVQHFLKINSGLLHQHHVHKDLSIDTMGCLRKNKNNFKQTDYDILCRQISKINPLALLSYGQIQSEISTSIIGHYIMYQKNLDVYQSLTSE